MIKIRHAKINDVEGIIDVHIKTWRTTYKDIINEQILSEQEAKREEKITQVKDNFNTEEVDGEKVCRCVATDNEKVVGFAIYGKSIEVMNYDILNAAEIYSIYVLKEYQGCGIGKKLMNFAVSDLMKQKYQRIVVWALRDNPYISFYKKLGGDCRIKKDINIGEQILEEVAFIYDDINALYKKTEG